MCVQTTMPKPKTWLLLAYFAVFAPFLASGMALHDAGISREIPQLANLVKEHIQGLELQQLELLRPANLNLSADLAPEAGFSKIRGLMPLVEASRSKQGTPASSHSPLNSMLINVNETLHLFDPERTYALGTALPLTRRMVMAAAAHAMLDGAAFDESQWRLLVSICHRLHQLQRHAAATKRIIEFVHVSKSGGTSMCQLAKLNGCSALDFSMTRNCMVQDFRDLPRWTQQSALPPLPFKVWCARWGLIRGPTSCKQRRAYMTKMKLNFYANEYVMHTHDGRIAPAIGEPEEVAVAAAASAYNGTSDSSSPSGLLQPAAPAPVPTNVRPCKEFFTVLVTRDPDVRLLSHLNHMLVLYHHTFASNNYTLPPGAMQPMSSDFWSRLAPAAVDNYMTRLLCGEDVYVAPLGSLTSEHLHVARMVMLQSETVMTLERETYNTEIVSRGLGWRYGFREAHARKADWEASLADAAGMGAKVLGSAAAAESGDEDNADTKRHRRMLKQRADGSSSGGSSNTGDAADCARRVVASGENASGAAAPGGSSQQPLQLLDAQHLRCELQQLMKLNALDREVYAFSALIETLDALVFRIAAIGAELGWVPAEPRKRLSRCGYIGGPKPA